MTRETLIEEIRKKSSYLCVGLDTDISKIPSHLHNLEDPIFAFNKEIIDATKEVCVSYKLNLAFYESRGIQGWQSLMKTVEYIPDSHFKIADAKRGDIGNTADMYAKAFFETMNFDAVTLSPYMGRDSIQPFLEYKDKWAIVLGLTSNAGSADFQALKTTNGHTLFETVIAECAKWGSPNNLMFVVGATKASQFKEIRALIPDHFLLVPGVGAQGGDLTQVSENGLTADAGLLINSSRGIIYQGKDRDFAEKALASAQAIQRQMKGLLKN